MMMVMQPGLDDITKQKMLQARALCREARGEGVNIGKKSSVPNDVMMEELNLLSNRGSRMFQERQKRVERYTLEKLAKEANNTTAVQHEAAPPPQIFAEPQGGKENRAFSIPGKHSLVMNLQKTVAKKGSPDVIAPGYSGPLKEIPHERFNTTVIPKSYSSPWSKAVGDDTDLLEALSSHLPQPPTLQPSSRCFNRSAMPFAGAMASERVIPVMGFVAMESQNLPSIAPDRMCRRPNFNRAPRGWGIDYNPESNEL